MGGVYTEEIKDYKIPFEMIVKEILQVESFSSFRVEQFCDDGEEGCEVNRYNVYKIYANGIATVLKKSDEREIGVYQTFLQGKQFRVPKYYGNVRCDGTRWMLMEYLEGKDLRDFELKMAPACAESITQIMNTYWESRIEDGRFARYWERINKRAECLSEEPEISAAYEIFLQRQWDCPRTLSHGDFLQYNAQYQDGEVYLVDWAFAGIMPYSLDIGRLIAHGTEDKRTFPFYMNEEQKKCYVQEVYQRLEQKPEWERYLMDVKLAVLNECVEFMEMYLTRNYEKDQVYEYYRMVALKLSKEINR